MKVTKPAFRACSPQEPQPVLQLNSRNGSGSSNPLLEYVHTRRAAVSHHCTGCQLLFVSLTSDEKECEEKNFKMKPVKTPGM